MASLLSLVKGTHTLAMWIKITGEDAKKIYDALLEQAKRKTAEADQQLDDSGKVIKDEEGDLDGVIIIEPSGSGSPEVRTGPAVRGSDDDIPAALKGPSKTEAAMLKVNAAQALGQDDDEPGRKSAKTPRTKAKSATKPSTRPDKTELKAPSGRQAGDAKSDAKVDAKKAKPKMRLVNGKLVPVDAGPGLF